MIKLNSSPSGDQNYCEARHAVYTRNMQKNFLCYKDDILKTIFPPLQKIKATIFSGEVDVEHFRRLTNHLDS
jgi:hypothetical protein